MKNRDKEIGSTVTELRGDRSQQSVADEMRGRGWKWSQATVWSVEKGERPLKLVEALDLAEVLGADLAEISWTPKHKGDFKARVLVRHLRDAHRIAAIGQQQVEDATKRARAYQAELGTGTVAVSADALDELAAAINGDFGESEVTSDDG